MSLGLSGRLTLLLAGCALAGCTGRPEDPEHPDAAVHVRSASAVRATRDRLVTHLWGPAGFPRGRLPSSVRRGIPSPIGDPESLERADELAIEIPPGYRTLAHHFIAHRPNGALVVVHEGHECRTDNPMVRRLLSEGFSVLRAYMPFFSPGDCTREGSHQHDRMFQELKARGERPMRYFLEHLAVGLDYLETQAARDHFPRYGRFHMMGLSGGGWTTTVYAAIDQRIAISIPVAGSIPLYLRRCRPETRHCVQGHDGDAEQVDRSFYGIAGYPDLYVLGATGPGRGQLQVLVRRDNCCFGEAQHDREGTGVTWENAVRTYERRVQTALAAIGPGWFRLEIDEAAQAHGIIGSELEATILATLRSSRRGGGAPG